MDDKYLGMTVNERLYVSGFMKKFYSAVEEQNVEVVKSILKDVNLTELSINPILEQFGLKVES